MENGKRLIDANAVDYENIMCSQSQLHWLNAIIEKQPTVDAAKVVRCKDCKYRVDDMDFVRGHFCTKRPSAGGYFCEDNDFCSYGKNR